MIIYPITNSNLDSLDTVQRLGFPQTLHEDMSLFAKIIETKNSLCYAAHEDNTIIGYILSYPTYKERQIFDTGPDICNDYDMLYLHDMCIHPDFQGFGIGKKLFNFVEEHSLKQGFKGIIATAIEGRLSFWENLGFKAVASSHYRGALSTRIEKYF